MEWVRVVVFAGVAAACRTDRGTESPDGDIGSGVREIAAGGDYTAVLFNDGHVRVLGGHWREQWGRVREIGFDHPVVRLAAGKDHWCVELDSGAVRCLGRNSWGGLGYGHEQPVIDPADAGDLDVGAIVDLSAGHGYTCVVVDGGDVRCWGSGQGGRLGYASRDDVLSATAAGVVDVGGRVRALEAGPSGVTCAVMVSGSVRCWGQNVQGTLGNASTQDVGAMDTPASAGDVALPGKVLQVGVGAVHVCAILEGGRVRCWGYGAHGRLGYPVEGNIGDDETPAEGRDVDVGGRVSAIAAGGSHTCALLESGSVRCWGEGNHGQLGYGDNRHVGEDQSPAQAGDVPLGTGATRIAAGAHHTCALLESGEVMCWGRRIDGVMSSPSPTRVRFDKG